MKLRNVMLPLFIMASVSFAACSNGGSSVVSPVAAKGSARVPQCVPSIENGGCPNPATPRPAPWPGFTNAIADGNFLNAEANIHQAALVAPAGFSGPDLPGFWYACGEDLRTHLSNGGLTGVGVDSQTGQAMSTGAPQEFVNIADFPSANGLEPWSAQIGNTTLEPLTPSGDAAIFGICYDFTVPANANLSFWAKEITTVTPSQPLEGYQTAAILASSPVIGSTFPAMTPLYSVQQNLGWKQYGYSLQNFSGSATLFFGLQSVGASSSLVQRIAGVAVGTQPLYSPVPAAATIPYVYAANFISSTITSYPTTISGTTNGAPPTTTIGGANTALAGPAALAVDPTSGNILVANAGGSTISVFPNGSNGNVTPLTLTSAALAAGGGVAGLAVDNNGLIYASLNTSNTIEVFAQGSTGSNVVPVNFISGSVLSGPVGMAFDSSNNLYVANSGTNTIVAFGAGASGINPPTIGLLMLNASTLPILSNNTSVAVDSSGRVIAGNDCQGFYVYDPLSSTQPRLTIPGPGQCPGGAVAVNVTNGNNGIFASNNSSIGNGVSPAIAVFSQSSIVSNPSPLETITGTSTGLNGVSALAIH